MKKLTLAIIVTQVFSLVAVAGTVAEKKKRDAVDEALAKSAADIKDCGKTFKVSVDWKAYDAIDWKKAGKDKSEHYGYEQTNVEGIGNAINKLCEDKDYKAALAKFDSISYAPSGDDKIKVKAVEKGKTLVLMNYTFASTRGMRDYENAIKDAL